MHRFAQNTVFPLPDPPAIPTTVTALDAPGGGGSCGGCGGAEMEQKDLFADVCMGMDAQLLSLVERSILLRRECLRHGVVGAAAVACPNARRTAV